MRIKYLTFLIISFLRISATQAQQPTILTLEDAVTLAIKNSDASKISDTQVVIAENELNVTKNNQYPDVKLSGQYMYLANADVNLKINTGDSSSSPDSQNNNSPDTHQLLLGQANISMPLFSGFKLKNTIKASENRYRAAIFNAKSDKEQLSLHVIDDYLNLYKATQTIALIKENLKSAHQRVIDFSAEEENGLLARNDLLKAQLQESNIQLSLDEAIKTENILNYRLAVLLKLPENTHIETTIPKLGLVKNNVKIDTLTRNDLESLKYQEQATENQIKIARSKFYPSLAITGGYIALDLQNALTVNNAINVGLGISYNLSDIFKAKSDIKLAKGKSQELQYAVDRMSDEIKVQIQNAKQNYELALKKQVVYTASKTQAEENYRIVKDKYDNGLADTNDLLEADVNQLQAKLNLTYSQADISQKYYELLAAQGQLSNTLNLY